MSGFFSRIHYVLTSIFKYIIDSEKYDLFIILLLSSSLCLLTPLGTYVCLCVCPPFPIWDNHLFLELCELAVDTGNIQTCSSCILMQLRAPDFTDPDQIRGCTWSVCYASLPGGGRRTDNWINPGQSKTLEVKPWASRIRIYLLFPIQGTLLIGPYLCERPNSRVCPAFLYIQHASLLAYSWHIHHRNFFTLLASSLWDIHAFWHPISFQVVLTAAQVTLILCSGPKIFMDRRPTSFTWLSFKIQRLSRPQCLVQLQSTLLFEMEETSRLLQAASVLSQVLTENTIPHAFHGTILIAILANSVQCGVCSPLLRWYVGKVFLFYQILRKSFVLSKAVRLYTPSVASGRPSRGTRL